MRIFSCKKSNYDGAGDTIYISYKIPQVMISAALARVPGIFIQALLNFTDISV